jgi:hypothetical protein
LVVSNRPLPQPCSISDSVCFDRPDQAGQLPQRHGAFSTEPPNIAGYELVFKLRPVTFDGHSVIIERFASHTSLVRKTGMATGMASGFPTDAASSTRRPWWNRSLKSDRVANLI